MTIALCIEEQVSSLTGSTCAEQNKPCYWRGHPTYKENKHSYFQIHRAHEKIIYCYWHGDSTHKKLYAIGRVTLRTREHLILFAGSPCKLENSCLIGKVSIMDRVTL